MADGLTIEQQRALAKAAARLRMQVPQAAAAPAQPPAEKTTQALYEEAKARGFGTGIPKLAYDVGGKVTDVTGSPKLGFVANVATQAVPALLSSFSLADKVPAPLLKWPAKRLMQSALKPSLADRLSGAADDAVERMLPEAIYPTRGGMDKAGKIVDKLHAQVEGAIAPATAEVNVGDIGQKYLEQYSKAIGQANPNADLAAVQSAWKEFQSSPMVANQETIPVQLAHLLKRGTQQTLGSKSYGEVGSKSIEVQKALARYLREGVAEGVPSVVEPLKREASLMNVRDVAMNRALAEANNNPLGLAALRMDNPLSALTFMADKSARIKAAIARLLYVGSQPQVLTPAAMATTQAMNQPER